MASPTTTQSEPASDLQSWTIRIDEDLDPKTIGADTGLLWSHDGFDLAGIGEACRIPLARPDGGAAASTALASIDGPDEVDGPGTGVVAFTSLAFDRRADGELIVPEVVVGRASDGRRWMTMIGPELSAGDDDVRAIALSRAVAAVAPQVATAKQATEFDLRSELAPEVWRDEVVAVARDRIKDGELDKAVLARALTLSTDQPLDVAIVIERLLAAYPSSIVFAVDGFVGASPELLVSRRGDVVRAHPLAGTAPRSSNPDSDRRLAAGLLSSSKDRWEHQVTIDWLLDTLLPFCSYVDAEPEPTIVSLANVHHLGTRVEGRLSTPAASALDLVGALHPTPAVGGAPQREALDLIAEIERADRGRYAGPTGWMDGKGNGSFAVAIRSAQISGNEARLFAGVGVVGDSDPAAELAETRAKFQAMLGALIRP